MSYHSDLDADERERSLDDEPSPLDMLPVGATIAAGPFTARAFVSENFDDIRIAINNACTLGYRWELFEDGDQLAVIVHHGAAKGIDRA